MRKNIVILLLSITILCFSLICNAETTGASFLKIGIGARAEGLGNAFTGVPSDDITAMHWNPGGLSNIEKRKVSFIYNQWLADTSLNFIGYAQPFKSGVIGASIIYLSNNGIEGRDENGNLTSSLDASDMALTASYSKHLKNNINIGANFKIIREQLLAEQAIGFDFDFGLLWSLNDINNIGISFKDFGPSMKFKDEWFNLPKTVNLGWGVVNNINNQLGDINFTYEPDTGKTNFSIGVEQVLFNVLSLRLGYTKAIADSQFNMHESAFINTTGICGGFGIKLYDFTLDYAFVPYSSLGNTNHISLSKKF